MFLGLDRIRFRLVDHLERFDSELVTARRSLVFADASGDGDRGLLRNRGDRFEQLGADVLVERDALQVAGAVADDQEIDLARRASLGDPALDRDD